MTAEQAWSELVEGNRRFSTGSPQTRDLVREREQSTTSPKPKAMVLACFDSRVAPEIIFDHMLGELFVVRVAGNVADKLAIGSLEFAAEKFGVPLLIVMGHQYCAGVKAAMANEKSHSPYLKAVIKDIRSSTTSAGTNGDTEDALREAERQNARHSARSILDRSELLRLRVERKQLEVVPVYYSLDSGLIQRI